MSATRQGFRTATYTNVSLHIAQTAKIDIAHTVDDVTGIVDVS